MGATVLVHEPPSSYAVIAFDGYSEPMESSMEPSSVCSAWVSDSFTWVFLKILNLKPCILGTVFACDLV